MEIRQYIEQYLAEVREISTRLDGHAIEKAITILKNIQDNGGRLFILGVGGSAASASHAVNDFRKIAGIEAYTPVDNVAELTARVNDDGWDTIFANWLKGSRLNQKDCILVLSVGGGNAEKNISVNLIMALKYAQESGAKVIGIVGRDGGYTAKVADACILIPTVNNETITPHTESFHGTVWHLLVTHPALKSFGTKWESTK